jgi:ribosome-binding factor A
MPKEFPRSRRVEEQIQRVLGDAIRAEARDPRLRGVILTDVQVSRDLRVARIYYSVLSRSTTVDELGPALESAAGFLRSVLARELRTRYVPELRFLPDEAGSRAAALEKLIDDAVAGEHPKDLDGDGSPQSSS